MFLPVRIFLISIILFVLSLFPSPFPLHPIYASGPLPFTISPSPSTDHHLYTQQVVLDLTSALTCQLVGIDPTGQKCLTYDLSGKLSFLPNPTTNDQQQVGGAIGLMSGLISTLYTPPASTGDYFRYLAGNFGIVKPAYAQGTGFAGLAPLLTIWTVFRNLAYAMFVLAFVVVGFAIMLRVRIDPRTVMTIQNQIPKLIIALLLVTFSFAIAGFLIDFMYVAMHLFFNLASTVRGIDVSKLNPTTLQGELALGAAGGLGGVNEIVSTAAGSIKELIKSFLGIETNFNQVFNPFSPVTDILTGAGLTVGNTIITLISWAAGLGMFFKIATIQNPTFTTPVLGDILNSILGGGKYATAAGLGGATYVGTQILLREFLPFLLAYLVIFIAILWALFRLTFELIKAYVWILIDVTFAPIWIMTGVLPGVNFNFTSWLRDILANLSVFPTTLGMFLLGKIFIDLYGKQGGFIPPLVGNPQIPGLLVSLIGIGILLLTPQVVAMVKEAFKAPQFKYAAAIGQAVGVGTGGVGMTAGRFGTIATGYELKPGGGVGRAGVARGLLRTFFGG